MPEIDVLFMFILASALLGLAPGPDNIFVLTQSLLHGSKSGIIITLGLCTGLLVHTTAVALGLAAIFQTSAFAFTVLKYIGALYLLYLALLAFRASNSQINKTGNTQRNYWQLYKRGIFMNITNPKVSIFFLAFLPQFTDPEKGGITLQLLMFGSLFIITALCVFGCISLLAGKLGRWLNQSEKVEIYLQRIAGTVFAALAVKLALSER